MRAVLSTVLGFSFTSSRFIPDRVVHFAGLVACALLAAYLANLLFKLSKRTGNSNEKGCLTITAVVTGAMLAFLIVGLIFHLRLLTVAISAITIVPFVILLPEMIGITIRNWRDRRK